MSAEVTISPDRPVLVYMPGGGVVIQLDDRGGPIGPSSPIERAVLIARLRGWADLIEADA